MNILRLVGTVVEPVPDQAHCKCICGRSIKVPAGLAGRRGICPDCNRRLQIPGRKHGNPRMGSIFGAFHPDRELKLVTSEPNLAPRDSAYLAAQRHTFIPGVLYLAATIVMIQLMLGHPQTVGRAIGLHWREAPWTLPVWLLAALAAAAGCTSTAAIAYRRARGKSYVEDRVGFAAAGGFDIARWSALAGYLICFAVCLATVPRDQGTDHIECLRGPWLFLLAGFGLAQMMTWWTARHMFRARFGRRSPESS